MKIRDNVPNGLLDQGFYLSLFEGHVPTSEAVPATRVSTLLCSTEQLKQGRRVCLMSLGWNGSTQPKVWTEVQQRHSLELASTISKFMADAKWLDMGTREEQEVKPSFWYTDWAARLRAKFSKRSAST